MRKLKNKVFWTIFTILTLFSTSILIIFNYQDYKRAKTDIERNLMRMDIFNAPMGDLHNEPNIESGNFKRFVDATIYTVFLNQDEIVGIYSHTPDGIVSSEVIKVVNEIIQIEDVNIIHIGNLYLEDYSYRYTQNQMILIDNSDTNMRLQTTLRTSFILFIMIELVIGVISSLLAKWMIQPVVESFEKQKQFIADASHELKTPLAVIMASAEALENNMEEKKWLHNIESESERMNTLIKSLLDLAKLDNTVRENIQMQDLSKLVEMAILPFESLIFERKIKWNYDIQKNIAFACNEDEIKQLVSILLDNAIKYTQQDGHIQIVLKEEKDTIVLTVCNSGEPIPKGEEEKIFERFYRVDSSRNRVDNHYGLGLSIAKRIVTNYRGTIQASSNNQLTTFMVRLPNHK